MSSFLNERVKLEEERLARQQRRLQQSGQLTPSIPGKGMHRALRIPDIVELILLWLDPYVAVKLGRTCHVLFDMTMDTVWRKLDDIRYIRPLLDPPPKGRQISGTPKLIPRAYSYLARVRALDIQGSGFEFFTEHYSPSELFPNLASITFGSGTVSENDSYAAYLLPGVTKVFINEMIPRCESGDGTINWRPFVKFLNAFERNPQHLDVFELTLIWSTTDALGIQEISKALCRVLHWHPELVRIKTAWIPGDLLCTLSSLPQLQELDLIFPASYGDAAIHFSDEGFKVLRKFTSSSYWSGNLCQVLMSIASTKLENIDVEMNGARSMGDGALLLSPFVPAILKHAASLRCLRLHPAARGVTESWLRFRPVLQCSLMEDFEFVCDGFGLTDDEIDDIVNSWPLLKHLHVKPKEREVRLFMSTTQDERAARVSCRGLRRLAECSHLLSLTLPLDLTNPHNDNMDPQATPGISLHSPLHSLDIGRAPFDMDAPDELEDFLRSIFPQLRNLSFERRTVGATDHTGLHTLQTSNKRWHILSTMRCNFLLPVVRRLPYKLLRKNGTMTYTHGVVYRQYMG